MNSSELMPVVARALVDCGQSMPTAKLTEFTEALTVQLHASFPITVRAKPKPLPPPPAPKNTVEMLRDLTARIVPPAPITAEDMERGT